MKEILKDMKLGQIIGIYHFEDSCFTVGKILKIDSKYLYLFSYDVNFKEDGIKVFLIDSIKRIILKSDYIEKNQREILKFNKENKDIFQELIENRISNYIEREEYKNFKVITTKNDDEYIAYDLSYNEDYLIFSEKEEFYDIGKINIIPKNMIESISKIEVKLDTTKENFNDLIDFEKNLEIIEILKKCLENKFLVFIDNVDFFETKVGVITNLEDNKIKIKEIDKYGNFYKNSEIYFDEIQLLVVKNYKIMERDYEKKI